MIDVYEIGGTPFFVRPAWHRLAGLGSVLFVHFAVLYALWDHRVSPRSREAAPVFVRLVERPGPPEAADPPRQAPPKKSIDDRKNHPVPRPRSARRVVAAAPPAQRIEPTAPVPSFEPADATPAVPSGTPPAPMASEPFPVAGGATAAVASEPVDLGGRLAVGCPERIPPTYPNLSRRIGEQGKVVLRVQLNERGLVTSVSVFASSGSRRLDEAALAAVRQWRCNPARRDGAPVPAVALQPIDFKLEER